MGPFHKRGDLIDFCRADRSHVDRAAIEQEGAERGGPMIGEQPGRHEHPDPPAAGGQTEHPLREQLIEVGVPRSVQRVAAGFPREGRERVCRRPWRLALGPGAFAVIELPAGAVEPSGTRVGDRLEIS